MLDHVHQVLQLSFKNLHRQRFGASLVSCFQCLIAFLLALSQFPPSRLVMVASCFTVHSAEKPGYIQPLLLQMVTDGKTRPSSLQIEQIQFSQTLLTPHVPLTWVFSNGILLQILSVTMPTSFLQQRPPNWIQIKPYKCMVTSLDMKVYHIYTLKVTRVRFGKRNTLLSKLVRDLNLVFLMSLPPQTHSELRAQLIYSLFFFLLILGWTKKIEDVIKQRTV